MRGSPPLLADGTVDTVEEISEAGFQILRLGDYFVLTGKVDDLKFGVNVCNDGHPLLNVHIPRPEA
jgi:hypothetical protein